MREIKFRAWNGEEMIYDWFKTVYNPPTKCMDVDMPENYTWACNSSSARAVMQYTGLKDKNGKEIYEGDIVYAGDCMDRFLAEVEYDEECYFFIREVGHLDWFFMCDYELEVIGNIHETPELLTNKG